MSRVRPDAEASVVLTLHQWGVILDALANDNNAHPMDVAMITERVRYAVNRHIAWAKRRPF